MINYEPIHELGETLVKCELRCEGINNSPEKYIIPRCLYLEKRNAGKTCIIIGINPGHSKNYEENEKEYYQSNGISYKSIDSYFQ